MIRMITTGLIVAATSSALYAVPVQPATVITEDDPGWSCQTMGNRVCGPGNSEGVTPGCYSDTGDMVSMWPCHVVVNADGSSDVYLGVAR